MASTIRKCLRGESRGEGRARRSETLRPIVRYAPTLPSPAGGKRLARGICRERRLLIELDGGQHAERPGERHRDRATCALGYAVICIGNNNVIDNLDGFPKRSGLDSKNGPSPRPSPRKRGEGGGACPPRSYGRDRS